MLNQAKRIMKPEDVKTVRDFLAPYQAKETPRPWYFKKIISRPYVVTEGGYVVAKCWNPEINKGANDEANASLIVKSVNNHEALLEACREALKWHQGDKWRNSKNLQERTTWKIQYDRLIQAIANATK